MIKSFNKLRKGLKKIWKFIRGFWGGVIIGLLVGVMGLLFFGNYNPPDENQEISPSTVFERIVAQNELVSVSQNYNITDKVVDSNRFFDLFDIPFTENSYWYRYCGTLRAGVNLQDAHIETNESERIVTISLEQPYIIANEPDMEKSGVLEENNNILNPIHIEDIDAFVAECETRSRQEAIDGGLLEEAKVNAEHNLKNLFYAALDDEYKIIVQWVDA